MIYLDHNATTPVDDHVLSIMLPYFSKIYGNAASRSHQFGIEASRAVSKSRKQMAELLSCEPSQLFFTSGATEAINLGIKGFFESSSKSKKRILTLAIEHKAVLDTCQALKKHGAEIDFVKVGSDGLIDLEDLEEKISEDTILVAVHHANNEIGVIQPIEEIGRLCQRKNVKYFVDGSQAAGKILVDLSSATIDMYAISGHKFYGPKGIGALYVNRQLELEPLIHGGAQESGLRSGTLNVPAIVGIGAAADIAKSRMTSDDSHCIKLRQMLIKLLAEAGLNFKVNGSLDYRLSGNLNILFPGADSEAIMTNLKGVALSNGSACSSNTIEASHVLLGIGLSEDEANSSIRVGIGRGNTELEIIKFVEELKPIVQNLQELSSIQF